MVFFQVTIFLKSLEKKPFWVLILFFIFKNRHLTRGAGNVIELIFLYLIIGPSYWMLLWTMWITWMKWLTNYIPYPKINLQAFLSLTPMKPQPAIEAIRYPDVPVRKAPVNKKDDKGKKEQQQQQGVESIFRHVFFILLLGFSQ